MDDILIHTKNLHEHVSLLRTIMEKLNEHQLQMNYNKMQLLTTKINFLGYTIQANKISPHISKNSSNTKLGIAHYHHHHHTNQSIREFQQPFQNIYPRNSKIHEPIK